MQVPSDAAEVARDPAPTGSERILAALALLPVLAIAVLALAGPLLSGDLWWHLRLGEWMLDHRTLPEADPFSHTARGEHDILQEYLSEVILALVLRAGGMAGLKALGALLGVAVVLGAYRHARRAVPPELAAALAALFALLYALRFELRPHLVSTLFLFAFASILFPRAPDGERVPRPREALLVLVLSGIWVQLHAEAIFAPLLALAGLIGAVLTALQGAPGRARRLRAWALVLAAALLGTLLSPLGWEPHVYALLHRSVPQRFIEEWFRPWVLPGDERFAPLTAPVFAAYWICALVGGSHVLALGWRKLHGRAPEIAWERIGFLAVCVLMSLQARRFLWLAWFPVGDLAAARLAVRARSARVVAASAALLLAWPLALSHFPRLASSAWREDLFARDADPRLFPVAAAEFIRDAGLEGNLFHPYEWGGYLGFVAGAACPVYIDGRTVLFRDVIEERWWAERDTQRARAAFAARGVRVVLMPRLPWWSMTPWHPPDEERDWLLAWSDGLARVWVRRDGDENARRVLEWMRDQDIELEPGEGFLEAAALVAHPEWLRERRMVPAEVYGELARARTALERARVYLDARMNRNARFELLQVVAESRDEETRALLERGDLSGALDRAESYELSWTSIGNLGSVEGSAQGPP